MGYDEVEAILTEHLGDQCNDWKDALDELETIDAFTVAEGLALRGYIELAGAQLDDAEVLIDSASYFAASDGERTLVLRVKALLAARRGRASHAPRN